MFPHMTPEMLKFINNSRLESMPTFEEYFEKRYLEECKYVVENPRFSISNMIFVSRLRENVRRIALDEYKKKYPLSQIILKSKSAPNLVGNSFNTNSHQTQSQSKSQSDIGEGFEEITMNDCETTSETPVAPRRSARLRNKSN